MAAPRARESRAASSRLTFLHQCAIHKADQNLGELEINAIKKKKEKTKQNKQTKTPTTN